MRVLASAGTPIALVLVTGRPRLLHGVEALPQVNAVLQSFLPGPHGGAALADALVGTFEPSGRLPLSWPTAASSLLYPHWHTVTQQCDGSHTCGVAWPFGHGLSYTTFELVDVVARGGGDVVDVAAVLKHVSGPGGAAVVQVYAAGRLRAFEKVFVEKASWTSEPVVVAPGSA